MFSEDIIVHTFLWLVLPTNPNLVGLSVLMQLIRKTKNGSHDSLRNQKRCGALSFQLFIFWIIAPMLSKKYVSQTLGLFTHSNIVLGLNGLVHTGFLFSKLN